MAKEPWTRIRPLQTTEVDAYTASALKQAELTWGHFPNNLVKTLGHCPALAITAVPYANSVIFDIDVFNNGIQFAGFLDRPLKELCISRTSLFNRSRYSVTHHSFIGYSLFKALGREQEGHRKLLHLHEHEKHPDVYTPREAACLSYAVKVARDPHDVTDDEFVALKKALEGYNRGHPSAALIDFDRRFIQKWAEYSDARHAALVDSQLVELTWLVGHFCLLNRWFTALQVPDEGPGDEADFSAAYVATVPVDVRERNEKVLRGQF
jgi:alkylhydroperoxidase family enzyme